MHLEVIKQGARLVILIIMSDDKEAVLQRGFVFVQEALHTLLSVVLLKPLQGAWVGENRADRGL